MTVEAELRALADALRTADAARAAGQDRIDPPMLRRVDLWDGSWSDVEARRASLPMPACLISLTGIALDHRGQSAWAPGQLRAAGGVVPPAPQVRADLAVTFIASAPAAAARAAHVLALAEAAIPVLVAGGVEDVRGQNLYAPVLYRAGLSAFALLGRRRLELAPAHPPRRPPARVDSIAEGSGRPETVWEAG